MTEIIGKIEDKPPILITDLQIKQSIRRCFEVNNMWIANDQLVIILYRMLYAVIIDGKKYVFLKAPTGSGKSIVGFSYSWCWNFLHSGSDSPFGEDNSQAYFLTSSKALQAQLQGDIDRFQLHDTKMLKGRVNYECTMLTEVTKVYHNYLERGCKNKMTYEVQALNCYDTCPYLQARLDASLAGVSILNYWYFMSAVRKPKMIKDVDGNDTDEIDEEQRPPLFGVRPLTICDESHLISDIIIGMYNLTLTIDPLLKLQAKVINIKKSFSTFVDANDIVEMDALVSKIYGFFLRANIQIEDVYSYEFDLTSLRSLVSKAKISIGDAFPDDEEKPDENENNKGQSVGDYLESLKLRPEDLLIETTFHGMMSDRAVYKHNVYDMDESMLSRKYFLSRMEVGIFMSATLPPFHEYAYMMGISKADYVGFEMDNGFDFSKSPIYLQASGYLNHKSFKSNIERVLWDTLELAECEMNRGVKGIIHTGTFEVSKLLQEMINSGKFPLQNKSRYLFYANSAEKEELINKMKNFAGNYIICGPSLYEGLDLKDDYGRINFLVKVPYQALTSYTEEKMIRYPNWYNRTTINKIEQSIGRTNRHKNDWSRTYLMDSLFADIIFDCDTHIVSRLVGRTKPK